jgi:hypothetical protein
LKRVQGWLIVTALVVAILVIAMPGCSWFQTENPITAWMKLVPKDSTSFELWDIEALRSDDQLGSVYETWRDAWSTWLDELGIHFGDVRQIIRIADMETTIIDGDLYRNDIKEALQPTFEKHEYHEQDCWVSPEDDRWVVLRQDFVIVGSGTEVMEDFIDVIIAGEDEANSIWTYTHMQDVVNKLPSGVITIVQKSTDLSDAVIAWGCAWQSTDEGTLKLKAVYKFDYVGAIEYAEGTIREHWKNQAHSNLDISSSDRYLEVEATIDNDDFKDLVIETL